MNFFVVDLDPRQAARDLCDKHVSKMHTEGIQMFVQVLIDLGIEHSILTKAGTLHKGCHPHPCVEWLKQSRENVFWAVDHVDELCYEHERRFSKTPYSRLQLNQFLVRHYHNLVDHVLPNVPRSPFAQALGPNGDLYRDDDAVEAYRAYYIGEKHTFAQWRYCDPPKWFSDAFQYAGV